MKVYFLTLSLDSAPWLYFHLPVLNQLKCDWEWHVVSGVAEPVLDTAWCKPMEPRLSNDGSHDYMCELAANHPRVFYYPNASWPGKTAMCNHATHHFAEPGLVWQLDSDELWMPHQIENVVMMFDKNPNKLCAYFKCDYWIGSAIKITSRGTYGDNYGEWLRVFRYRPGMKWLSHEPPILDTRIYDPNGGDSFTKEQTEKIGLVFQHYAYATEKQVALKEAYYGYANAVAQWRQLKRATNFPLRVGDYLSWVKDAAICDKITPPLFHPQL